jgi:hypothetical protein
MTIFTLSHLVAQWVLSFAASPLVPADHCPLATLTCRQSSSNPAHYECGILAHYPSKRNAPQYAWAVSGGKMLGDLTSPNVTVDVSDVKSELVTVTAEVHWRKIPQVCDAHMEEKIKLR